MANCDMSLSCMSCLNAKAKMSQGGRYTQRFKHYTRSSKIIRGALNIIGGVLNIIRGANGVPCAFVIILGALNIYCTRWCSGALLLLVV